MQRFLFRVSLVFARNAWHNDPLLFAKYEDKRIADIRSLAAYANKTTNVYVVVNFLL